MKFDSYIKTILEDAQGVMKLRYPNVQFSAKEEEQFKWAWETVENDVEMGQNDPSWQEDNPDGLTVEGQLQDLYYRVYNQSYDMVDNEDPTTGQSPSPALIKSRLSILNSVAKKLESVNYFDPSYHTFI